MPATPATSCLTGLIGLTRGNSTCFPLPPVTPPATNAALTDSASGLYLDEADGLILKPAQSQAAGQDLYALLASARANAEAQIPMKIAGRRSAAVGVPLFGQQGTIGGLGNGQLLPAGTPARIQFYTQVRRFGAFRILSVQLYTNVAVTAVPLLLDGQAIGTLTATGPGGAFVPVDGATADGLRIPFDGNPHTLEAVLPEGVRVHANNLWCAPCQRNTPWGLALGRNLTPACASATGGGFAVQLVEECTETLDPLCYALSQDPELRQAAAFAVLYKAAELFVLSLAVNAQSNRYLMLSPKELDALGAYYADKNNNPTDGFLPWLAGPDGIGRHRHPCYAGPASRLGVTNTL